MLPIGWFARITFIPAVLLIGVWFLIQVFCQIGSVANAQPGGGVASAARVGGFIVGAIIARLFERSLRIAEA